MASFEKGRRVRGSSGRVPNSSHVVSMSAASRINMSKVQINSEQELEREVLSLADFLQDVSKY